MTHNHSPGSKENFDCPGRGCGRIGKYGFDRKDHLREHLRKWHAKDIPKPSRRKQDSPGDDVRYYKARLQAPSEHKAQGDELNEIPPPGTRVMLDNQNDLECEDIPKYSRRRRHSSEDITRYNPGLIARSELKGQAGNEVNGILSLSSQFPYVAGRGPATASGIERSVSHDLGVVDKESPGPTNLESVKDVQVAPEPRITQSKSTSQSVKLGYEHNILRKGLKPNNIERRPSTISVDVECSTMMITGDNRVQDTVKPAKVVSEPDKEARLSILHHSIHNTPLTVMDADDKPMSSLSDGGSEQPQLSDDGIVGDGQLCYHLAYVYHLINQANASLWKTVVAISNLSMSP